MANQQNTRSGSDDKKSVSGSKSQKSEETNGSKSASGNSTRGGTPEQHAEAGRQSHKNDDTKGSKSGSGADNKSSGSSSRGGSSKS